MATSALYKLSALVTPAGTIPSLMNRDINPGLQAYILRGDGNISPGFRATMSQTPMFKASSVAIAAALTVLGSGFYTFAAATTLYMAKLISGGGLGGSSTHAKLAGSKGCIIPRRLRAEHGKEATLDFDGYFLSTDGATAPFAYTGSVSLPSITPGTEAFTLGSASINGTALAALKRLEIDFGYKEIIHSSNGELYPTFGCYDVYQPTLSFATADPTLINTLTVGGLAQSATASTFYLQKLAATGRVAAATAQHIKLTVQASSGFYEPGPITENDEGESEIEVSGLPLYDGTNAILGINLASAIT